MKRRTTNNNAANVGMLLSLLWYLVIGALFSVNALAQHAIQPNVNEKASPTVKTMGVQVLIYLYDKGQCEGSVLPAYRAFAQKAVTDPLVMLLRDVIPQVESIPTGYGAPSWSPAIYEDYIATLTGKEYYSSLGKEPKQGDVTTPKDMRILVDELVAPDLIRIFCLPRNLGFKPEQGMSSTALMTYLYSQSRWIEDYFTFAKEVSGPVSEGAGSFQMRRLRHLTKSYPR